MSITLVSDRSRSLQSLQTLRRYWRLLKAYLRPHRTRMALLGLILVATIAVEIAAPLIASRFINEATDGGALSLLLTLAALTMALTLIGQVIAIAETWVAENVSWDATNALRADLAAHVLGLDGAFHAEHTAGELIERVDGDVATLSRFFSRFIVYVLGNTIMIAAAIAVLMVVDWRIGLGLGAFVAVAMFALLRIRASATPLWAAERQQNAAYYGFLGEHLAALEDIRSSGAVPYVVRRYTETIRTWLAATIRANMRGYAMVATSQGIFGLGTAFAFAICALLYRDGALSIGTVYLVIRYTDMLRHPTEVIRDEVQELQQADASITRIETLLRTRPRLPDGAGDALPPGPLAVAFDHVTFGYANGLPALRDVSFALAAGRVLGVVGRTGSGKTSLTRLLPRFYDPTAGSVRLNGLDPRNVRIAALRERIGLVTQEVHLFHANIRDNLTLFDPTVPDARLHDVLRDVGLEAWLAEIPDGLETHLGPGGIGLSAGQAQVLACARMLLRDPDLVILDEASSRLDPATERLVHRALGRLLEGRTGVIVAHRLATLAYTDDILVLEDGQVREFGPRLDLAADPSSHYARLLRTGAEELIA